MPLDLADKERIKRITISIRREHERLRNKYKWLRFQDLIGFSLLAVSSAMILTSAWFWYVGDVSTWFLVVWIAFWTSILHEIEHDLIHGLYFKNSKVAMNFMFGVVWFFRPLTLNPWIRKYWHHHHHQHSGKVIDIEERGVTNGERWSLKRLIMTPDLLLSFLLRCFRIFKEIKAEFTSGGLNEKDMKMLRKTLLYGFLPLGIPAYLVFYTWIIFNTFSWFGIEIIYTTSFTNLSLYIDPIIYILILPNYLRQFCLHLITSNMHFYGDVEDGDIFRQTQVLNAWWTWPFQLFCFNFGATHSIHHFVVNEPFYTRQMSMKNAHVIFRKEGVKFNDTASFSRANSFE